MDEEYEIVADELDEPTCWRLLARIGFGRVGFVHAGDVVVLPVNVAVIGQRVVFRTGEHTSLAAAGDGTTVAFEADHTDQVAESGWSVLVRGQLHTVTDAADTAALQESGLHPWAPDSRDRWMTITPTKITGRMIQRHRNLPPGYRVPYMPPD